MWQTGGGEGHTVACVVELPGCEDWADSASIQELAPALERVTYTRVRLAFRQKESKRLLQLSRPQWVEAGTPPGLGWKIRVWVNHRG